MDFLAELIMEAIPDAFMELIGNRCTGLIKARVHNPALQKVLCAAITIGFVLVGIGLAAALLLLIGYILF